MVATGNSLAAHVKTIEVKIDILSMLREKGLERQVKHIVAESAEGRQTGVHPLFLGLHYGRDVWRLETFPLHDELKALEESLKPKTKAKTKKTGAKPGKAAVSVGRETAHDDAVPEDGEKAAEKQDETKKGGGKNVPKNKKQA